MMNSSCLPFYFSEQVYPQCFLPGFRAQVLAAAGGAALGAGAVASGFYLKGLAAALALYCASSTSDYVVLEV